jgi:hypothetical protein
VEVPQIPPPGFLGGDETLLIWWVPLLLQGSGGVRGENGRKRGKERSNEGKRGEERRGERRGDWWGGEEKRGERRAEGSRGEDMRREEGRGGMK